MSKIRNFFWWCRNHPNIVWLNFKANFIKVITKKKMIKHEIYISTNKVSLRGIWAWLFIGICIIDIINLILWSISAVLKMIILFI